MGVNIHRGVADSGHYWSMIHSGRGEAEPDPEKNLTEWRSANEQNWKKFDDESVDAYNISNLEIDSFGGETTNYTS